MKLLISFFLLTAVIFNARGQQQGLDTSFGALGIVMVPDTALSMQTNRMALQADGKIVVAGSYYYYLPSFDLVYLQVIMRFNTDGSRDSSFNHTGFTVKEAPRGTRMGAVRVQPDNRILIATTTYAERYLPDGRPDSSFNDSARFVLDLLGPYDGIYNMALQNDGKVLLCGRIFQGNALLFRLKANGTPDTSFGYNGLVNTTLDSSLNDAGFAVATQPDGKILLGGSTTLSQSGNYASYFSIIRYLDNGGMDPTFNNGKGYTRVGFPAQSGASAYYIGLQPGGKIVAGGNVYYYSGTAFSKTNSCMTRLTDAGIIDSTFGINGRITDDTVYNGVSSYWFYPRMSMQPDGKVLMALSEAGNNGDLRFALHRFNANGFIDVAFGTQGKVVTDITINDDMPDAVLMQPDGKILVCGISNVTNSWPQSLYSSPAVVRYESSGHLAIPEIAAGIANATIYPNPAGSSFTLKYGLAHDDVLDIHITDIMGRTVQHFARSAQRSKGDHTEYFALSPGLAAGNYFLVLNGKNDRKTIKIVHE